MAQAASDSAPVRITALNALHRTLGARMVPFAGYDMPVQYPDGIIAEHNWTRSHAGLFDVSHMGQVVLRGAQAVAAIETLVPGDIQALKPGTMRYTMFTNAQGGILDDLMVTKRAEDELFIVVNAGCKDADIAHMRAHLPADVTLDYLSDRALLALQGPDAKTVMARLAPASTRLVFMTGAAMTVAGFDAFVTRSGYTGEDGFEISVANADVEALAKKLLAQPEVKPIGLGARDSLRLEAGLCLYGHDIDTMTTPIEAVLAWTISKRRRAEGGFPGASVIQKQLAETAARKRVGIRPQGRAPVREGAKIFDPQGRAVGIVTSGGFGPSVGAPVAMGYVETAFAQPGQAVQLDLRGKMVAAEIAALPFSPHRYAKS